MPSVWETLEEALESHPEPRVLGSGLKLKDRINAQEDAKALKEAMKGLGTNEKVLVEILTQRSNAQRQQIREAYEKLTDHKLERDLKSELKGHLEDALVALVQTPAEFDCHELMRAMKGAGSKESILIEIFASRTNEQIRALSDAYLKETEHLLIRDLRRDVSGDFSKALLLLLEAKRDESVTVDERLARKDAKALQQAAEKKWGTDEDKFIEILCERSMCQLRQTCVEYRKLAGKTLQKSIESEMKGDLEALLVAIVKCVKSTPAYFAEELHKSMKGGGTCESTLSRIMVSRSEIDMMDIRKNYRLFKQHSLYSAIDSDVSGDYGDCMKALCGGDN
ncbi:annexin A3a [Limanda limanda]|uniref:annexin A3a n=1 Tax=Limanda limanda TaxID=27771 RepID=UPI0029C7B8C2|nr:annexin A3a [Limanda limanda]